MGLPWWHVLGNHDLNFDVKERVHADETFERVYGPSTYAFEIGDVLFLVLNNVIYPNTHTQARYVGGFPEQQLQFVKQLLAHTEPEKLVVSMMHIPLFTESYAETFVDTQRRAFLALFANHRHTFSLSAHTHTQNHHFFTASEGWPHPESPHHHYNVGTTSGSWWRGDKDERGIPVTTMRDGVPNGYAILHFDGNQYSYDYKVANGTDGEVMRIHVPRAVHHRDGWSYALLGVNVYNGCDATKVEFRVGEGNWRTTRRELNVDPIYAYERLHRDHIDNPTPVKSLPYPSLSTHLWTARLPTNLEPGLHHVQVRVTDRFGREFSEQVHYRILPPVADAH
jgi:hypothetical protein